MSSVLKSKVDASQGASDTAAVPEAVAAKFEPLQNGLCEALKAITQEEFEPSGVEITPVLETDIQPTLDAPGLKLAFSHPNTLAGFAGSVSPSFAAYVCRHSLLFSGDTPVSGADYVPSKLDCLLLRPIAERIAHSLSALFRSAEPLSVQVDMSFNALDISKPQIKAMGERVMLKLSIAPLLTRSNAGEADVDTPALHIDLIVPRSFTNSMSDNDNIRSDKAPTIDPTHPWAVHMRETVNGANVPVRAVVESYTMTVAECTRLEIGQVIELPGVSLDAVQLFIDMDASTETKPLSIGLAQGSLGIFKKNRALKMTEEIDPDFIQDLNLHTI